MSRCGISLHNWWKRRKRKPQKKYLMIMQPPEERIRPDFFQIPPTLPIPPEPGRPFIPFPRKHNMTGFIRAIKGSALLSRFPGSII